MIIFAITLSPLLFRYAAIAAYAIDLRHAIGHASTAYAAFAAFFDAPPQRARDAARAPLR